MEDESWYALFVKTGDEDNVKARINYRIKDKFNILVPKRTLKERKKGIWINKIRTILPGYVLLKGDINVEDYYSFKDIPGIINLIRNGETFLKLKKEESSIIERLTYKSEIIGFSNALYENDKVLVLDGPLKNLEGYIISVNKRKNRAKIRINFMEEERNVELGINFLKASK
ncbi:MAG: antiterminator LoaP [Clostridiales bacterium]